MIFFIVFGVLYLLLHVVSVYMEQPEEEKEPEEEAKPTPPQPPDNSKYYCVEWNLRTGDVIEYKSE
jgi:hypothetical protein